jgi:hypothetical protein
MQAGTNPAVRTHKTSEAQQAGCKRITFYSHQGKIYCRCCTCEKLGLRLVGRLPVEHHTVHIPEKNVRLAAGTHRQCNSTL